MSVSEYAETVLLMMENQDRYFNWFLSILGIVLVFAGVIQWRLSSKQIEQIKEKTKKETIAEIEKLLEVSNLIEFKNEIQENLSSNNTNNLSKLNDFEKKRNDFEYLLLDYEILKLHNKDYFFVQLIYLIDIFKDHLSSHMGNLNYFIARVDSLISIRYRETGLNVNSTEIDKIITKMSEIEGYFNEKSERLEQFEKHIKFYRNESK